ncbi:MAG: hypothetical protein K8S55_03385 [Phycisphaerae bacterium]|nr:hypothetical protein [Phycisphaerae bacterium]
MTESQSSYISELIQQRLSNPDTRENIAEIFSRYYEDLLPILVIATTEADGVRPEGLSNEVYACFHHIARALCEEDVDAKDELASANKSHIKRAILDSYKIAINSYLAEASQAKDLLDYMVLVKEFGDYVEDGVQKAAKVKKLSTQVKQSYQKAKNHEMKGAFGKSIEECETTLDLCEKLREALEVFTSDRTYIFACEREAQRKQEKTRDRKIAIWIPIVCAILASALTATLTAIITIAVT